MIKQGKTDIFYVLNSRFPTVKAHGLQVAKNCEAFELNGAKVTLIVPIRKQQKEFRGIDAFESYGIKKRFRIVRLPSLDVVWLGLNSKFFFALQQSMFALLVFFYLVGKKGIVYSRDRFTLYFLSFFRENLFWEVHQFPEHIDSLVYRRLLSHVTGLVVITAGLKKKFVEHGFPAEKILVAPDGVDLEEFNIELSKEQCRAELGLPANAKIIGYVGQLRTLGMDKGVDTLIEAFALLCQKNPNALLVIVGGDEHDLKVYKKFTADRHLGDREVLYTGRKNHNLIPKYLRAFDIAVMPFPFTEHFAYYMSPLKLFEYMAAGKPIIASDLPAVREILNQENSLLVKPNSRDELVQAMEYLIGHPDNAERIARKAYSDAGGYSWRERCGRIQDFIISKIARAMDHRVSAPMTHLEQLEKSLGSLEGKKILDLGAGPGSFLIECARRGYDAVGLEIAEHKIKYAHGKALEAGVQIDVRQGRAEQLPFQDDSFDFINASELVEHAEEPDAVLAEIHRILKTGGQAYVSVHNRFGFRDAHFKMYGLNWMPRWLGERYLLLLKKHKEYHPLSGRQRISEMNYYTFGRFRELARGKGFNVVDMRREKLKRRLLLPPVFYRMLRFFYFNTFHVFLTKPIKPLGHLAIGYLTYDTDPRAGWGRYANDLISSARKLGAKTVVLKERRDDLGGVVVLRRGIDLFGSVFNTAWHLKNCDIVHALDVYPYGIIAWLANIFINKKLIITAQGTYSIAPFSNWKTRWLSIAACGEADRMTSVSRFTAGKLLEKSGGKDIKVIPHGIDLGKFSLAHRPGKSRFMLSVGALKFRKGYHISIPAFAEAKKKIADLKYVIVGNQKDSGYYKSLQNLAEVSGVRGSVEFVAGITDGQLRELYQAAELFLLTSVNQGNHAEGFGLVFLEAAAAGLPCVGTLGNGIEDAVNDGHNGVLVPQGQVYATADAIVRILGHKNVWQKMSQASKDWAQEHELSGVIQKYSNLYREIFAP